MTAESPARERATMTAEQYARLLVRLGFLQTSRKYRALGRVPEGTTAKEALYSIVMREHERVLQSLNLAEDLYARKIAFWQDETRKWVNMLGEDGSRRQYVRCYACGENERIVSEKVLKLFREYGGQAA